MTTTKPKRSDAPIGASLSAALLALLGASFGGVAAADVPSTIHETGRLFQLGQANASTPLQGSRQLTFNLYSSQNATAASAVWSEIHLVDVADGYFSVELGTAVPLPALLRSSPELWLGIQVDTDEELQPRFRLDAVPYALLAADVQGTINPTAIRINGTTVINAAGQWVGSSGGAAGPAGPSGPAGPVGPAGPAGASGAPGPMGPTGPTGLTGATGPAGANGAAGPQGPIGPAGTPGPSGPVGPAGATGLVFRNAWLVSTLYARNDAVFYNGSSYLSLAAANIGQQPDTTPAAWTLLAQRGAAGPQGTTGTSGPQGPAGVAGMAGPIGPTGAAGPKGATGPQGPVGATGTNGATGPQGSIGFTGPAGPAGANGATGLTGPQGPTGPTGPAGAQGLTFRNTWTTATAYGLGDAVAFNGGSYISLLNANVGQQPDVSLAAWGVLAQKGAAGVAGATGATGPAGPVGPAGSQGIAGIAGPVGPSGAAGPKGATGATGPQGPIGATGANGTAGAQGPIGVAGPAGSVGPAGANGAAGPMGPQGPAGPAGGQGLTFRNTWATATSYALGDAVAFNGASYVSLLNANIGQQPDVSLAAWGLLAQKGATGAAGTMGATGLAGPVGATGPAGPAGATGSPGSAGPQGPVGVAGPSGATGPAGVAGPQGIPGVAGVPGPQGIPGTPGAPFALPFAASQANAGALLGIANTGDGDALDVAVAGNGTGVSVVSSGSAGKAASFSSTNAANTGNILEVLTNSSGDPSIDGLGGAYFFVNNTSSTAAAVKGEINTIFSNFGAAAVYGKSSGTGGVGGLFYAGNTTGNGPALLAVAAGNGSAVSATTRGTGNAGLFTNTNASSTNNVLEVDTNSAGSLNFGNEGQGGAHFLVNNTNSVAAAVKGEINSIFSNFGAAAVYGKSTGTGGTGGLFYSSNTTGGGNALVASTVGNGSAIVAVNTGNGDTLQVFQQGPSGNIAVFENATGKVARIDKTGKGFFNGGTQVGGADLAEFVPTTGAAPQVGDVVEIDPDQPDRFRLSSVANNGRVAGVISTAPGVTLNAGSGAIEAVTGAALALAGRVPVKVTGEGGPIHIGDLLVSAPTAGHAMRAPAQPALGTVIGKALRNFDQQQGCIEMLVMLR